MKYLIFIILALFISCEEEGFKACGPDQVYNDIVKACVLDVCRLQRFQNDESCYQGCLNRQDTSFGQASDLGESEKGEHFYHDILECAFTQESYWKHPDN